MAHAQPPEAVIGDLGQVASRDGGRLEGEVGGGGRGREARQFGERQGAVQVPEPQAALAAAAAGGADGAPPDARVGRPPGSWPPAVPAVPAVRPVLLGRRRPVSTTRQPPTLAHS